MVLILSLLMLIHLHHKESYSTAGLSTINGLVFNSSYKQCYPGNLMGSSSAFCESPWFVRF